MLSIKGQITRTSVNQALGATTGYRTDLLRKPWHHGTAPLHIRNNTDWPGRRKTATWSRHMGATTPPRRTRTSRRSGRSGRTWIEAELREEHDAGDHTIAVARSSP